MSEDLVAYLRARLDEERCEVEELTDGSTFPASVWYVPDSDSARECIAVETPGPKTYRRWWPPSGPGPSASDWGWTVHEAGRCLFSIENARRVLADIEAKWKIIDEYESAAVPVAAGDALRLDPHYEPDHAEAGRHARARAALSALGDVLRILVQPYASRPDFNQEWITSG